MKLPDRNESPEIVSVVLTLRPQKAAEMPAGLGRAAQALLLSWIKDKNPSLAETLHSSQSLKPYTCSSLMGARSLPNRQVQVDPGETYALRYTSLSAELSAVLLDVLSESPSPVELDYQPFALEGWTIDPKEHRWAGHTTYQHLAAAYLLGRKKPSRYTELEFASPVMFRSNGQDVPIPLPVLVFGSLADKWNELSPVAIAPEVRRYTLDCMAISRFSLRSQTLPFKEARTVGGVGRCLYVATVQDRYWMSVVQLLADWAFYAGAGAKTTSGLGQVRRVEKAAPNSRHS